ncbi:MULTISPECIES: iron ABC transporter permease [unclassified Fusibacter]|uniref:ABC transporter permease n=1 Tax=unclassified Fusibacter TaxID=2624464 RepID=UPI001011C72B|nr:MULTISPECIES: iron ABC transporter permease [unclassified Fusibacter]MCK8059196.1 iron ABC transporter permease [Fusibacter sp. A2]NPE22607.1 iron ABC transporter permease [Fusibacter sp. A1]RXV60707.1 iron ABC transporter permease [Fusibacter sp. A1]
MLKRLFQQHKMGPSFGVTLGVVLMICGPISFLLIRVFSEKSEYWDHVATYLLPKYMQNTGIIALGVAVAAACIGVFTAYFMTFFDFPLKRIFRWLVLLPLAIPPYIGAVVYFGMLSYTGVVQQFLRGPLGLEGPFKSLNIMNIGGVIFIFSIFLYPYVYAITYTFMQRQANQFIESARTLGYSMKEIFFKLLIPLMRVPLISSVTLVVLEVLSDYGVVNYYGVPTFSTAIFKTWFSMGDVTTAIRLALLLISIVLTVLTTERLLVRRKRFGLAQAKRTPIKVRALKGWRAIGVTSGFAVITSLGFIIPTLQLIQWALMALDSVQLRGLSKILLHTISLAACVAAVVVVVGLVIAHNTRKRQRTFDHVMAKLTISGYALPGAVIAIGVTMSFIALDRFISGFGIYEVLGFGTKTLVISSSIVMLGFALIMRFMAIGYNNIESGMTQLGDGYYYAARLMGLKSYQAVLQVDVPMLKTALLSSFALVFVDVLKELPLTLVLRPFNFTTLATRVYEYANDEMIHEASVASLLIIGISMMSVWLLYRMLNKED